MANFLVSYDLNGKTPTHGEMDDHLKQLGKSVLRVLETVWFVPSTKTKDEMYAYVDSIVSHNDRVLVIVAADCTWRNLLASDAILQNCWEKRA